MNLRLQESILGNVSPEDLFLILDYAQVAVVREMTGGRDLGHLYEAVTHLKIMLEVLFDVGGIWGNDPSPFRYSSLVSLEGQKGDPP